LITPFSTLQSFLSEKYQIPFAISSIVIQKLYEDGYLTYPRTNTEYLANNEKEKIAKVIDKIKNDYGYLDIRIRDSKRIFNDLKIESHSAITPTVKLPNIFELEDIEQKIYKTVLDRFLSNFVNEECIVLEKEMLMKVGEEKFSIIGKTVKQLGYLKYEKEEFTDKVPDLNVDDEFDIDFKVVEKTTTKPPRISESNLSQYLKNPLRKLNNIETDDEEYKQILEGVEIGTEATRTGIIETAKKMGYISQEKNSYKLEPLGEKVIEILNELQLEETALEGEVETPNIESQAEQTESQELKDLGLKVEPSFDIEQVATEVATYVQTIIDDMDVEATISNDYNRRSINLQIDTNEPGRIIGYHGKVLKALQLLAQNYLYNRYSRTFYITINVNDYVEHRAEVLQSYAQKLADRVLEYQHSQKTDPMSNNERKIIHRIISKMDGLTSYSEGDEPNRYVVVDIDSE